MGTLQRELVGPAEKRKTGEFRDPGHSRLGKAWRGIDSGADRRAAERKLVNAPERILDPFEIIAQHRGVAGPFLAERERRCVLHMGSADLYDIVPFGRFCRDGIAQFGHRRNQAFLGLDGGRDVHGGREAVVGGLRHVDMVVRMNRALAAQRGTLDLAATVGDDLVNVHVELRAAAGHPHVQWKHLLMFPRKDFVADARDQLVSVRVEATAVAICGGCGALQDRVGADHLPRHQIVPDAEMFERPLGL